MKCTSCNAQWEVSSQQEKTMKNCPFCGTELKKDTTSLVFDDMSSCLGHISTVYGNGILDDKGRFISVVSDLMRGNNDDVRLIKVAIESGIPPRFEGLDESDIATERQMAIMILMDKYFLGREHAERATDWIISGFFKNNSGDKKKTDFAPEQATKDVSDSNTTTDDEPAVVSAPQANQSISNTSVTVKVTGKNFPEGVYNGDMLLDKRHGYGVLTYPNGARYAGEWKDDKPCGKGTKYSSSGHKVYYGDYQNGVRHGFGTEYYAETKAIKYEGYFKDGKRHGFGTKYNTDGSVRYQGELKIGKTHGFGTAYYSGGGKYEGNWKNGKKHGKGKEVFPNGQHYEGEYTYGLKNGEGTFYYSSGAVYVGEWKDGKCHGRGVITFPDKEKYEGEFAKGVFHGQGIYYYKNGDKYVGEFANDERSGQGTYYFFSGDQYEGQWKHNKYHGHGTIFYPNGKKLYEGEFQDGKYHGHGTIYSKLGFKLYSGKWKNGERN